MQRHLAAIALPPSLPPPPSPPGGCHLPFLFTLHFRYFLLVYDAGAFLLSTVSVRRSVVGAPVGFHFSIRIGLCQQTGEGGDASALLAVADAVTEVDEQSCVTLQSVVNSTTKGF